MPEITSCHLQKLSSWKIGGLAYCFHEVHSLSVLAQLLHEWPGKVVPVGGFSNLLISDRGVDCNTLLVHFGASWARCACLVDAGDVIDNELLALINELGVGAQYATGQQSDNGCGELRQTEASGLIYAEAGARLGSVVQTAMQHGLADATFLAGIPGTVGGAVRMNAGAHGDELWRHVVAIQVMERDGRCAWQPACKFHPGYREVIGLAEDVLVVAALLQFSPGDTLAARKLQQEQLTKRRASQPLEFANCGSVFRNPPGDYAARLIEACGLKGYRYGGAEISSKHANFIVNRGGATSQEVWYLINLIQQKVMAQYGVQLQLEVKLLGCFDQDAPA